MSRSTGKPLTLAHVLRGRGGQRNIEDRLTTRTTGIEPGLRRAIVAELMGGFKKATRFERPKGSKNDKSLDVAAHVEALVKANPSSSITHEAFYQLADRQIIGMMPRDTFKRYVQDAKKKLGIKSQSGRPRK